MMATYNRIQSGVPELLLVNACLYTLLKLISLPDDNTLQRIIIVAFRIPALELDSPKN